MRYEINDFVLLDLDKITMNNMVGELNMKIPCANCGQIIDIYDDCDYPYFIKLENDKVFFIKEDEIIEKIKK